MKNTLSFILIISILLVVAGCTSEQDNNSELTRENIGLSNSITNNEIQAPDRLTSVELQSLLELSNSIEVKNIDNQMIGKINTGDKITKIIEDIFSHTTVDEYEYSSDENVIATINFYPSGNDPIYGLIKENFIYIEGYYFTSKNNSIQKIIDYFKSNTENEPIVGD